jgi:hypothetical protein
MGYFSHSLYSFLAFLFEFLSFLFSFGLFEYELSKVNVGGSLLSLFWYRVLIFVAPCDSCHVSLLMRRFCIHFLGSEWTSAHIYNEDHACSGDVFHKQLINPSDIKTLLHMYRGDCSVSCNVSYVDHMKTNAPLSII